MDEKHSKNSLTDEKLITIEAAVTKFSMETIGNSIHKWPDCLKAWVEAKHFK